MAANNIIDYGFEDWTGDADTTPGYIFNTAHWSDHENGTHGVSGTCGGVAPNNGSYYFHQQHYSGLGVGDDPCLGGSDNPASVNPHTVINFNDFDGAMPVVFLHFYFQTNAEFGTTSGGYRNKWIELIGNTSVDGWAHFSSDGGIHMHEETSASWGAKVAWPGGNPHGDGDWHSFAMYINISTGEQSLWLDTTDWDNPTETRDYSFGGTTAFTHLIISENFSGDYPDSSCWVKFDDIEVWDDIPSGADTDPPTVSGNPTIASDGTTVTINFSETVVTSGYTSGDFDLDCTDSGNNISLSSPSGSGSSRTFTAGSTVYADDTCNCDFNGAAASVKDEADNDMSSFTDQATTNNSTQTSGSSTVNPGGNGSFGIGSGPGSLSITN
jgi:hypothetical protein